MAMKNIGKPNLSANLKTGFKLMGRAVSRGHAPQRPTIAGKVASNHPMASSRAALSGGRKRTKMY